MRRVVLSCFIVCVAILATTAAASGIYRCAGQDGVAYSDRPCAVGRQAAVIVDAPPPPATLAAARERLRRDVDAAFAGKRVEAPPVVPCPEPLTGPHMATARAGFVPMRASR